METWYVIRQSDIDIEPIQVLRSTPNSIFTPSTWNDRGEERRAKWSEWCRYLPTREEAVEALRSQLTKKVESSTRQLERDTKRLAEFNAKERLEL